MSKRVRLFCVSLIIVASVLLSGCYRSEILIKVNKKAKVKISANILASKDYYSMNSDKTIKAKDVYKKLKKQIKSDYKKSKKSIKFKKIKKTIKKEKYYGYKVTGIKSNDMDGFQTYKKNGRIYVVYHWENTEDELKNNEDIEENGDFESYVPLMKALGMSVKMKITFPAKPKTTYGKVKGKTVTIDLMDMAVDYQNEKDVTITMSCKIPK